MRVIYISNMSLLMFAHRMFSRHRFAGKNMHAYTAQIIMSPSHVLRGKNDWTTTLNYIIRLCVCLRVGILVYVHMCV